MWMQPLDPNQFIPFAEELANASGDVIRRYYRNLDSYDIKGDDSPVTKADKEVERTIRAMIRNQYPEHGIIGEEYEPVNEDAPYIWVIDPIDGTKSFMIGRPIFGTLISLLSNQQPILGMINQPITGDRWSGIRGYESNFNFRPCYTRKCADLSEAVLCTTAPELFDEKDKKLFDKIAAKCRYVVYGGDCYSYGLLASGMVDLVIETGLKPYDFCAFRPIIEGAKGVITDWKAKQIQYGSDGRVIAAGDQRIHSQVMDIIRG